MSESLAETSMRLSPGFTPTVTPAAASKMSSRGVPARSIAMLVRADPNCGATLIPSAAGRVIIIPCPPLAARMEFTVIPDATKAGKLEELNVVEPRERLRSIFSEEFPVGIATTLYVSPESPVVDPEKS